VCHELVGEEVPDRRVGAQHLKRAGHGTSLWNPARDSVTYEGFEKTQMVAVLARLTPAARRRHDVCSRVDALAAIKGGRKNGIIVAVSKVGPARTPELRAQELPRFDFVEELEQQDAEQHL